MSFFNWLTGRDQAIAWKKFAASIGGEFVAGPPMSNNSSRVFWKTSGSDVVLEAFSEAAGEGSAQVTRVRCVFTSSNPFRLKMYRRGLWNILHRAPFGFFDRLDNSLSNERFVVRTNDTIRAAPILDNAIRCEKKYLDRLWTLFEIGTALEISPQKASERINGSAHELIFKSYHQRFVRTRDLQALFELVNSTLETLQLHKI